MNRTIAQPVDPANPTPLYLQIAEHIRDRIRRGELAHGEALTPLREAAEAWGVNVHTVRHAYAALAREGFVETSRGPRGTRVLAPPKDLARFVMQSIERARREYGLAPEQLIEEIRKCGAAESPQRPIVWVIECSLNQCESHADEIMRRFDVDARALPLDEIDELPADDLVATYFHYNDIRRAWPHRLRDVQFVSIGPDPRIRRHIPPGTDHVRIVEIDLETAEAIAADLSVILGESIAVTPQASAHPSDAIEDGDSIPVIFPPRAWQTLNEDERRNRRAIALDYLIDPNDLRDVAHRCGWPAQAPQGAGKEHHHA